MRTRVLRAHRDERGEGVISAAIAVLIMAFLGAAMWVGFNTIWDDAERNTGRQVERIGDDDAEPDEAGPGDADE